MYPANQYMDPYYSHYRDLAPYPYYPPPGCEAGHPRMSMDLSYRPPSYGPCPYSASMNHPHPPEFHSCCNHTCTRGPGYYSFRPPFPQELQPPHLYYHGPFPHHPNAYPSYFVPPPPYPVDQTPYGYDKYKSHCCGCPNHVCHGGEKSNVKIEEERPEVKPESEQKVADNSSIIRHPNYEYPMIWLPSSNMNDKENGRSVELPTQFFNGWVPVNGKRTGHVKQQEQDNQKAKQFQWPIIWMPAGYDEPKQEAKQLKETDENPRGSEEAPPSPNIKNIPLSWFGNDHHEQKPAAMDGSGDQNDRSAVKSQYAITEHQDGRAMEGSYKTTLVPKKESEEKKPVRENYKTIPVLPKNDSDEKKPVGGNYRTIPVVSMRESDDDKPDASAKKAEKKGSGTDREGENGKRNNGKPSNAKHSKLPPVCLRVDPLPRKKPGNGSLRSPSTPTRKDADRAKEDVKEAQSQNQEPQHDITVSDVKEKSPDEMKKGVELSNGTVQAASVKHAEEEVPTSVDDQKVQGSSNNVDAQEIAGEKSMQGCAKSTREDEIKIQGEAAKDDARTRRINFSEPDAALRIQSAYRGYHVRRWQPLEKLRMIKNVHEQMEDVKKQLQDLEASSKLTEKEQMAIGETIMNLLLNLDTIQGLHSSVREARKAIARELICLQEKLDSLCKQLSGEPNHTIGEEEKPEGVDTVIQTTASVSTAEASEEEKAAAKGEGQEVSSVGYMEPLHDAALSEDSNVLKQCTDSTEHNGHTEESHTWVSRAATEDSTAALATASLDGSVEGQVLDSAAVESSELKHDVAPAEEDQGKEPSASFVHLEDSSVSLKDAELHEHDPAPADDSTVSSPENLPEKTTEANVQQQVTDTTQDSNNQPDGTPGPSVGDANNVDYVTAADAEKSAQSPLLEETSQSDSALEQTVLEESEAAKQCEVPGRDDSALMDQPNEPLVENSTGGSAIGVEPPIVALVKEADTKENALNVAGAPNDMGAEPTLPESESSELPREHDGIRVHDNPDSNVSFESQSDAQKERANGNKTSGGMEASESVECNQMLKEAPGCATGTNSAEVEADTPKEDAAVQTASQEAAPASATHDGPKNDEEKKLAEENQKLKEMLQKLLASGNDQMGVITELSEKVKTLERKLARKKRPKVRVNRPVRNATATAKVD